MPGRGLRRRALAIGAALVVTALASPLFVTQRAVTRARSVASATPVPATPVPATPLRASSQADVVPADPAAEVAQLLTARGQAVTSRSSATWLATLDPAAAAFATTQQRTFAALTTLKPHTWSYRFAGASPMSTSQQDRVPGGWLAEVDLTYQIVPEGPVAVRRQYLTMVPARGGTLGRWRIAGDGAGRTERDLWDLAPITVTRMSRCLVIGVKSQDGLVARVARTCRAAAEQVDAVWGRGWPVRTVLIVPGSQAQLGTLLGTGTPRGLDQSAAVTTGPAGSPADEVLINPEVFDQLQPIGYRVVLTHELVHVATRATGSSNAPIWLSEGFADYVGYLGTGLPSRSIATEALDEVAQGLIPTTFPPDDDFETSRSSAAAAYGFAWAAADTVAQDGGIARLVAFYRAASGPDGTAPARLDRAARSVLKLGGTSALVSRWRQHLKELAR